MCRLPLGACTPVTRKDYPSHMADNQDDKARESKELYNALLKQGERALVGTSRTPSNPPMRLSRGKTTIRQAVELLGPRARRNRVFEFYWLWITVLGCRVYEAGLRDFMLGLGISACTGIAAFLLGDHDWMNALVVAVSGLMLWLWAIVFIHFVEAPYLIHVDGSAELKTRVDKRLVGIGGLALLLFLVLIPVGLMGWYGSGRSLETGSKDSLRNRTISVANKVQHYLEERAGQHPAYAYPDSRVPNPTDEQKQKIATCQEYDGETWNHYRDTFMAPMVAIVKEYKAKGVDAGYLENGLTQHLPWVGMPNMPSVADVECMQDICKFKELAYHVDAKDNRIDIP